ncbi:MAG: saccharopine dehydrogenase NADP-binding domain-containing protein [Verrucomicrobiales bacterium]|nr:saccharopine dehydrogenase NADP-binding domain-containing protein [Verrucomicrobiales bacterium]
MTNVLLLGAGKIGRAIGKFLGHTGDYKVTAADYSEDAVARLSDVPNITTQTLDVTDNAALARAIRGHDAVISALSFAFNPTVAKTCLEQGASYFDLTEDIATTKAVKKIAKEAVNGQIFMPQCGLAPGFTGIVGNHLAGTLDEIDSVLLRVGALPLYPTNALKYNLTWSTDGLINEYCNPCEAIHDGKNTEVLPLEGMEHFSIDGVRYEAFNTSGGLGTLCETLHKKAHTLNYKTVRYPGHRDLAKFLVNELKLKDRRDIMKDILENAIPMTLQDVVLVFCTVTGKRKGNLVQISDARKIYHGIIHGEEWSAIQITTAAGICTALDLHVTGKLPQKGFVKQEQIKLPDFLDNRFGQYYELYNKTPIKVRPLDLVVEES